MKEIENSKKIYDEIEIPEELSEMVEKTIEEHGKGKVTNIESHKKRRKFKGYGGASVAAAAVLCLMLGLNTSEAFAMGMSELPVIGSLARVLTIRSYHGFDEKQGIEIDMDVPQIAMEEAQPELAALTEDENAAGARMAEESENPNEGIAAASEEPQIVVDVNAEIQKIVDEHIAKAEKDFAEYKEAFFATGGTEEEWADRTMDVDVNYEIKYQDDTVLSLALYVSEGWVASYQEQHYYNLNLAENRKLTLEDVLGTDYVNIANTSIISQMEARMAENENYTYWGIDEQENDAVAIEGFTTVDENTAFYLNEAGNPVISYAKYEIAPGFMGEQTFEIKR